MNNRHDDQYMEALDHFLSHGGSVTVCPSAGEYDSEEWDSLRDFLEPYKTCDPDASRWSVGSDIAYAIRESHGADLPSFDFED